MGITGTNADGSLTLWLSFEPSPGHLKPQHHLMVAGDPEEGMEMCVKGPTVSEHPRTLGRTLWHPEIRPSPALLLQPQGGMASSHGRVLLFPKYVCCINTVIKGEPSVSDGGVIAGKGEAVILVMAGCVQPAPVSVGEERPCSPSGCQAVQTLLSSTSTLLEQFRDLGEEEATGRRRRGQPGSHAKLLPGSKALLDSEKQFGFHLSFDP